MTRNVEHITNLCSNWHCRRRKGFIEDNVSQRLCALYTHRHLQYIFPRQCWIFSESIKKYAKIGLIALNKISFTEAQIEDKRAEKHGKNHWQCRYFQCLHLLINISQHFNILQFRGDKDSRVAISIINSLIIY